MNAEEIRNYVLKFSDVDEGFPFGEDTLVFKTRNKIFLLLSLTAQPLQFNVKCDPEVAARLRDEFACVLPGYHMNKKHWNTIIVDGTMPRNEIEAQIAASYSLVASPKKKK